MTAIRSTWPQPTFRGKHNVVRSWVYCFLALSYRKYGTGRVYSVGQLHEILNGIDYSYLQTRLPRYYNYHFLGRKVVTPAKGRPCYGYFLAERGRKWVEYVPPDLFRLIHDTVVEVMPRLRLNAFELANRTNELPTGMNSTITNTELLESEHLCYRDSDGTLWCLNWRRTDTPKRRATMPVHSILLDSFEQVATVALALRK